MAAPAVLLLHGLYMAPWVMWPLGRRLAAQGFSVHYFAYRSWQCGWADHVRDLAATVQRLQAARSGPLHLVGHSLGGLVVRTFAASQPPAWHGRCVTLGTPHRGSAVARQLHRYAPYLLGAAYPQALDGCAPPWPAGCEWGSLAGSRNLGVGRLCGVSLDGEGGDGTVGIAETRYPGGAHRVLPVSHASMLWNADVAAQTGHFLRHGYFAPLAAAGKAA